MSTKQQTWDRLVAQARAAGFLKFSEDGVAVLHRGDADPEPPSSDLPLTARAGSSVEQSGSSEGS